jgi:hypothetical protein
MIERTSTHPAARFAQCRQCGHEPRHIIAVGRTSREPVQFIASGQRHHLECRCGARTAKYPTLTHAETEWGADYAQLALPLRIARRRKVAA